MKMRKWFLVLTALLLTLVVPAAALAEGQIEQSNTQIPPFHGKLVSRQSIKSFGGMSDTTNTYYARSDDGYVLCDAEGQVISAAYSDISVKYGGPYYQVNNGTDLNGLCVIDSTGKEILPQSYGDIQFYGDHWILGITLEPTTDEQGDYHDSNQNQYNATGVDVYFDGAKIGTLTRDEALQISLAISHGHYLYMKTGDNEMTYLSSTFEKTTYTSDSYVSTSEYDYTDGGYFHRPTNQQAFVPGCTLTPDQVDQTILYNGNGDFIDLQGNVISQGPSPYKEYDGVDYDGKEYLSVRMYREEGTKYGVVTVRGEEVIFPQYDELGGYLDDVYFPMGYQAVLENGALKYVDLDGNVTAATSYNLEDNDYKGFSQNAPMVAIEQEDGVHVVTAIAGELPQRYEDYQRGDAYQPVLAVKLDGMWGVIDMYGTTIVPFECKYAPTISRDGTMVIGNTENGYVRYTIAYQDEAAPSPICPNCGYEATDGIVPNFCPNCGAKLQ